MALFKSKEEKMMEAEKQESREEAEISDEQIGYDTQNKIGANYASSMTPEEYYAYKKMINIPEAQAEFVGKIDKDVVFADLGGEKPTREELRFQIGTIELYEGEFVEERMIIITDPQGNIIYDDEHKPLLRKVKIFDEEFRPGLNFLKAEYKFDIVGSRAQGKDTRAAMLDGMTTSRIQKELTRKQDNQNSKWKFG